MNTSDARDLFSDSPDDGWRPLSVQALAEDLRSTHPQITVLRFHTKGGMGAIYEGRLRDEKGDTISVAIKVLRPDAADDADYLRRFRREQDILATLGDHPHIVHHRLHGTTSEGYPFIVMDWVPGRSLVEFTTDRPESKLTRQELLQIADDLCSAVQHAHEHQVLHRDLKPQNIIVTDEGRAIVLDFGIARSLRPGNTFTQPGDSPGTLGYIAPEVQNGERPDERADIYSLGIILYQLLMKKLPAPFSAKPSDQCIDPRFDEIVMKAANPDKLQRYPSAEALRETLVDLQRTRLSDQKQAGNFSNPDRPRFKIDSRSSRLVEVIVNEISLTLNGVTFFETLDPAKISSALREQPRKNGLGNYTWDQSGIQFDQMGGSIRFYFDVDEAKKNGFWSERLIVQAPKCDVGWPILAFGKQIVPAMNASDIESEFPSTKSNADSDGFYHDIRGLEIRPHYGVSNVNVSVEFSRFPPKSLISVTITVKPRIFDKECLGLPENEALIANVGYKAGIYNMELVLTDKHLIAINGSQRKQWDLRSISALHVLPRGETWWTVFSDRDRVRVELASGQSELLEGEIERGYGPTRLFRKDHAFWLERFVSLLQLTVNYSGGSDEVRLFHPLSTVVCAGIEREIVGSEAKVFDMGMVDCCKCQNPIADDALTCPHCGSVNTQGRMEAERVETIGYHWFAYLPAALWLLASVIATVLIWPSAREAGEGQDLAEFLVMLAVIFGLTRLWHILSLKCEYLKVAPAERVIHHIKGVINQTEMNPSRQGSIPGVERTLLGRIFGYSTLTLELQDGENLTMHCMKVTQAALDAWRGWKDRS